MNITINTQTKTVTVELAEFKELSKVKKALEAMGENVDEYKILSAQHYYNYPILQPYVYPNNPTWYSAESPADNPFQVITTN